MSGITSTHVCSICGLPVGLWDYGWKHQAGKNSRPRVRFTHKPIPIRLIPRIIPDDEEE